MCNTITIRYSCNHFVQFHRSTCRSVIWVTRATTKIRKVPKNQATKNKHNSDLETPSRGRTLERSSSISSSSPSPLSSQTLSLSPASKLVSRPACKSTPEIMFRAQQKCGPCQRISRRGFLDIRRARSELPSRKKRKHLKRGWPLSGGSPLKHELTVEELLKADDQTRKDGEAGEKVNATTETSNSITRFLHLEPARFWKCWRRFDDIGRRYVDFRKG